MAGLNEQVTKAASTLGRNVPGRAREIQIMLLQLLTFIITKKPYTIRQIPVTDSREKSKIRDIEPNQKVNRTYQGLFLKFHANCS